MPGVGRAAAAVAGAAVAAVAIDAASKAVVEQRLDPGEQARGPLGIRIRRVTNDRGVAGSATGGTADTVLLAAGGALAASVAGAGALLRRPPLVPIGAGLAAGGMLANLADRIGGDGVTDFLVTPIGVVNAADLGIAAGMLTAGLGLALRR